MRKLFVLLFAALLSLGVCCAQQVTDGGFKTIGHVKSDGTVQDSGFKTIGHANGIKREWAAWFFFFRK